MGCARRDHNDHVEVAPFGKWVSSRVLDHKRGPVQRSSRPSGGGGLMSVEPPLVEDPALMAPMLDREGRSPPVHIMEGSVLKAGTSGGKSLEEFLGVLEEIRAEAQNVRTSVQEITASGKAATPAMAEEAAKATLTQCEPIFHSAKRKVEGLLESLTAILSQQPSYRADAGDEVRNTANAWERAMLAWPKPTGPADEILPALSKADGYLRQVVYHSSLMTIPHRTNRHLESVPVGRCMDFNEFFKDEVPDDEDRSLILHYLRDHCKDLNGLVDVANGVIYPYDVRKRSRNLSLAWLAGAAALGLAVVYLFANLGSWANLPGWPVTPSRWGELVVAYLFVLVGGFAHIFVDALKRSRAAKGEEAVALEEIGLWLNIKQASILQGIAMLVIGVLGLAFTMTSIGWELAFFTGYTIDSVVDIYLQRFETEVSAKRTQIQKAASGTGG